MQPPSPTGAYQRLEPALTPTSSSITDDAGQPISPPPDPPPAERLEQFDRRMVRILTASGSLMIGCAGLLGAGIGGDELAFLIPGAGGLGVSLAVTALALRYGRETYSVSRMGDNRAIALGGLIVSLTFGIFTGVVSSTDSSDS